MKLPTPTSIKKDEYLKIESPLVDPELEIGRYFLENPKAYLKKRHVMARLEPNFPVAKYVSVVKISEAKETFILSGVSRRTRRYAVGIMTTDNRFYFNMFKTVQNAITKKSIPLLHGIFLRGYNYNMMTRFVLSENMLNVRDPVRLYLTILATVSRNVLVRKSLLNKVKTIERVFRCGTTKDLSKYSSKKMKKTLRKMYDDGMF